MPIPPTVRVLEHAFIVVLLVTLLVALKLRHGGEAASS
jgi:hypothetical protein